MKRVMVRYKVKDGQSDANEVAIRAVFDELKRKKPSGLRYVSFKLEDGVSFVHIASIETKDGSNPLLTVDAFKAFQQGLKGRVAGEPVATELHAVGSYELLETQ